MLQRHVLIEIVGVSLAWMATSCTSILPAGEEPTGVAADVAGKAQVVAGRIGGPNGFGGPYMMGYSGHMAQHMGFHSEAYLADPDGDLVVQLTNSTEFPCTFHLAYIQSGAGLDEQTEDILVLPGQTFEAQMPCAEIMGVGSLTDVGTIAVDLPDGSTLDNRYCVPGFLNSDYLCGGSYGCVVATDASDLDQDGDTEELIVVTSSMWGHMGSGGMGQHMWDYQDSPGSMMNGSNWPMMGEWFGWGRPGAFMMRGSQE